MGGRIRLIYGLALALAVLPLIALFVEKTVAQTSGCTTVATVKCLWEDPKKTGDCGSCSGGWL